jgi:hypothetical protein
MLKIYDYDIDNGLMTMSFEVDFLADTLTKEELKVFDAWERNAKNRIQ